MKTTYFHTVTNLDELRRAYYKLAMQYQPDRGGDEETMKAINNEYDWLSKTLINGNTEFSQGRKHYENEVSEVLLEKIGQIISIDGLIIEIIGSWIWITGNTYPNRKKLGDLEFRFSKQKTAWYWHHGDFRKRNGNELSLDEIRDLFGSQEYNNKQAKDVKLPKSINLVLH